MCTQLLKGECIKYRKGLLHFQHRRCCRCQRLADAQRYAACGTPCRLLKCPLKRKNHLKADRFRVSLHSQLGIGLSCVFFVNASTAPLSFCECTILRGVSFCAAKAARTTDSILIANSVLITKADRNLDSASCFSQHRMTDWIFVDDSSLLQLYGHVLAAPVILPHH